MSDALTRAQLQAKLEWIAERCPNVTHYHAEILAHDAAQRATIARLEQLISDEPRCTTTVPPEFQRLWEACNTLVEKAQFKAVFRVWEQLEARLAVVTTEARDAVQAAEEEAAGLRKRLAAVTEERNRLNRREDVLIKLLADHENYDGPDTIAPVVHGIIKERDAALATVRAMDAALDFAHGAIVDAISLDDGLDGATGEACLRIIVEAKERGTFDEGDPKDLDTMTRERRKWLDDNEQLQQRVAQLEESGAKILTWIKTHPRKATISHAVIEAFEQAIQPPAPTVKGDAQ